MSFASSEHTTLYSALFFAFVSLSKDIRFSHHGSSVIPPFAEMIRLLTQNRLESHGLDQVMAVDLPACLRDSTVGLTMECHSR
jgi:hypothetical protein